MGVDAAKIRDAPACTLAGPVGFWTCSLRFQETAFPDQPRVTVAPSDFRRKRAVYARRPFRHSADTLTSALPNLSLHSQFGPLRMGMHCGKKGGGCLTAGPVANMNLTRLNSNSGLYEHTRSPTKADLTVQMRAEAWTQRPIGGSPSHDGQASKTLQGSNPLSPPTTTTTTTGVG